jgi:hypothetical protein
MGNDPVGVECLVNDNLKCTQHAWRNKDVRKFAFPPKDFQPFLIRIGKVGNLFSSVDSWSHCAMLMHHTLIPIAQF